MFALLNTLFTLVFVNVTEVNNEDGKPLWRVPLRRLTDYNEIRYLPSGSIQDVSCFLITYKIVIFIAHIQHYYITICFATANFDPTFCLSLVTAAINSCQKLICSQIPSYLPILFAQNVFYSFLLKLSTTKLLSH